MQKRNFEEAVEYVLSKDSRYAADGYAFLRDALDFTLREVKSERGKGGEDRHVSGPELLEGFRRHALEEFGPMALTVLAEWGLTKTDNVGDMVFNLIDAGVFGKAETDELDDFRGLYEFATVFTEPFLPSQTETETETEAP